MLYQSAITMTQDWGFSAFIAGECVMAAAGKVRGGNLTQSQFVADTANFFALLCALTQHQFVVCRRITPGAGGIKLCLIAVGAVPARKPFDIRR